MYFRFRDLHHSKKKKLTQVDSSSQLNLGNKAARFFCTNFLHITLKVK